MRLKAVKSHLMFSHCRRWNYLCELIFLLFLCFRPSIICTGGKLCLSLLGSGVINCCSGVITTCEVTSKMCMTWIRPKLRFEMYRLLTVNRFLHDTVLEYTNRRQHVQCTRITRIDAIKDKTDDNFLPSRDITIPKRRRFQITDMSNILHDTVECSGRQYLIFLCN